MVVHQELMCPLVHFMVSLLLILLIIALIGSLPILLSPLTHAFSSPQPLCQPPAMPKVQSSVLPPVRDMLEKGVVEPVMGRVFLSRPFTVPKNDLGKTRQVMDLI